MALEKARKAQEEERRGRVTEERGRLTKIEEGLWIAVKGFPPTGEEAKVIYFAYRESVILKAVEKLGSPCYIYQLKYSY